MPNHVRTKISMKGIGILPLYSEENGKQSFDFNKLIPQPESLNLIRGMETDEAIVYYLTDRCSVPLDSLGPVRQALLDAAITSSFLSVKMKQERAFRGAQKINGKNTEEQEKSYQLGEQCLVNVVKYGCPTWYEWCCKNWGTKWNAYDFQMHDKDHISFSTAWGCPEPVILALSRKYPHFPIECWWEDEAQEDGCGHRKYKGGQVVSGVFNGY